jgi:general secretion pathway protein G
MSILSILAALILPSAQLMARRNKEIELRRSLRAIRYAIDDFKKTQDRICDKNPAAKGCELGKSRYPESLDVLVEGYDFGDQAKPGTIKFLRRIPCDPFAEDRQVPCKETWNYRAYEDKDCSTTSGGKDVYDVCTKSEATAIDGSKYKDW